MLATWQSQPCICPDVFLLPSLEEMPTFNTPVSLEKPDSTERAEPQRSSRTWGGPGWARDCARVANSCACSPPGLLVDQSKMYSRAFYSCAAGMCVAAVCLALVRPCKKGLCQPHPAAEGQAESPRGKALQDIPEDFLEMDLGKNEHKVHVKMEPVWQVSQEGPPPRWLGGGRTGEGGGGHRERWGTIHSPHF